MSAKKKLKRTKQCAKCPWKKSTNPHDIPYGYSVEQHEGLRETIGPSRTSAMACHEDPVGKEDYCIGWLMHQLGPGNDIVLRLKMMEYDLSDVQLVGEQHQTFEETLPCQNHAQI